MEENMSKLFDNSKVKIEGDHIEIEIDGVIVTGKILERHRGEIIVSITDRKSTRLNSSHL